MGLSASRFLNNSASEGGALWLDPSEWNGQVQRVHVTAGSHFEGNSATQRSGGAVKLSQVNTLLIDGGSVFSWNLANGSDGGSGGGAVWAERTARVAVGASAWQHNRATGGAGGGALRASEVLSLTLADASFVRNSAPADVSERTVPGGALSVNLADGATVALSGSLTAQNNSAGSGGFLGLASGGTVPVFSISPDGPCMITGNRATRNSADGDGGAIQLTVNGLGAVAMGRGCVFSDNSAGSRGGALFVFGSDGVQNVGLGASSWQRNAAMTKGGGVYLGSLAQVGTVEVRG